MQFYNMVVQMFARLKRGSRRPGHRRIAMATLVRAMHALLLGNHYCMYTNVIHSFSPWLAQMTDTLKVLATASRHGF
jgi:hypothetical protein